MKRKILTTAAFVCCFMVFLATTMTGIDGSWTGTASVDGNDYTENFVFKVDGSKLTGTTYQDQDDPRAINEGKVNGTDFVFSVSNKDGEIIPMTGAYYAVGDSISLTVDYEGKKLHLVLKRAKDK